MSTVPWKPNPTKQVLRLIEAIEGKGYAVTSVEIVNGGGVRVGVQQPGAADRKTEAEELGEKL